MDSSDESNVDLQDKGIPILPSIQDRRKQLEAFQAERAQNKSLRASVRGNDRDPRPSALLSRSVFRPTRSVSAYKPVAATAERVHSDTMQDHVIGGQEDEYSTVQEFNTRRIVQHFDAMSKKSASAPNLIGVRRHGVGVHRVEKKFQHASSWTLLPGSPFNGRMRDATSGLSAADKDILFTKVISESEISLNDEGTDTTGVRGDLMVPWGTGAQPGSNSLEFIGTRSVRQDRPSTLAPGKRQEEIYLSQARLLQWYMMSKSAAQHFKNQKKSAEAQFKVVEQSILEKEEELQILQKRLGIEKELVELEYNMGAHRDWLLTVISELQSLKDSYGALSTAIDAKSGALSIPGVDEGVLQKWLAQIHDCQVALDTWSKKNSSMKDGGLLPGITRIMKTSCDAAKHEIQELLLCLTLLHRIREAESLESNLLVSV